MIFRKKNRERVEYDTEYPFGAYVVKINQENGRYVLYCKNVYWRQLMAVSNHATEEEAIQAFENIKNAKNYKPLVLGVL